VHVIYGVPGLKTHAKLCLVVRREGDTLVRYCHIGTGNYNETTARVYTDLGLFSARPDIVGDVAQLFNALTGFSRPSSYAKLLVAPNHMKRALLEHIRAEASAAKEGREARMVLKCNAVVDKEIIEALYSASEAGVSIDLLVRGICCAVPGVEGMSTNIRVKSVVGRFLEHHRVYHFHNDGDPVVYLGSADLMDRNLDRRVEVLAPVLDARLKRWLYDYLLKVYLEDTTKSHVMQSDGSYTPPDAVATRDDLHHRLLMDHRSTPP
jgi:polyphosphate kinase